MTGIPVKKRQDCIDGLIWCTPNLGRLDGYPDIKVVYRTDWNKDKAGKKKNDWKTWVFWMLLETGVWQCFCVPCKFPRKYEASRFWDILQLTCCIDLMFFVEKDAYTSYYYLHGFCRNHVRNQFKYTQVKTKPYHPWDWHIYLYIYHNNQPNVGKYASPMDGIRHLPTFAKQFRSPWYPVVALVMNRCMVAL